MHQLSDSELGHQILSIPLNHHYEPWLTVTIVNPYQWPFQELGHLVPGQLRKKNGFPIAKTPRIFRQAGAQGGGATLLLHAAAEALG